MMIIAKLTRLSDMVLKICRRNTYNNCIINRVKRHKGKKTSTLHSNSYDYAIDFVITNNFINSMIVISSISFFQYQLQVHYAIFFLIPLKAPITDATVFSKSRLCPLFSFYISSDLVKIPQIIIISIPMVTSQFPSCPSLYSHLTKVTCG